MAGKLINRLYSDSIIKPSISPWRVQIVVVKNTENNKRRICVDYSQKVNLFIKLDAYPLPKIEFLINELAKYCVFSTFDLRSAYHQVPIAEMIDLLPLLRQVKNYGSLPESFLG